ncbi:MAG: Lrp/AsnC family transcriptional regulator [Rhodospirillales bacterium]
MQDFHIDGFDHKLLTALAADGSLTNQALAARVGLSESQCYRRRLRLEQSGAIQGYRAVVAPRALGQTVGAFVLLSLINQSSDQGERFANFLESLPNVQSCHAVTGDADFILQVRATDLAGLNDFLNRLLAHGKSRFRVESRVILATIKGV